MPGVELRRRKKKADTTPYHISPPTLPPYHTDFSLSYIAPRSVER
jgi:hypothetical protein